jgi:hypothetical protein
LAEINIPEHEEKQEIEHGHESGWQGHEHVQEYVHEHLQEHVHEHLQEYVHELVEEHVHEHVEEQVHERVHPPVNVHTHEIDIDNHDSKDRTAGIGQQGLVNRFRSADRTIGKENM